MLKLEVKAKGDTEQDLVNALEEVIRLVEIGNCEGFDMNTSGEYNFEIEYDDESYFWK